MNPNKLTSKTCKACSKLAYIKDDRAASPVCDNARNFDYRDYEYKDIAARCVYFVPAASSPQEAGGILEDNK